MPRPINDPMQLLQMEISDLKSQLDSRDQQIEAIEATIDQSEDQIAEWQAKYERLFEAHRKLQKTNHSLEDKLLRIVDKFESEKNQMTRDLASQTQKLVEAKLTIQQLHDQNRDLQADLHLSISLLQNKPCTFMPQRIDTLPPDMQSKVRTYLAEKQADVSRRNEGKKIRVEMPQGEKISAAILAKVLEERAKERKKQHKFCIDVGTQTHGWLFPEKVYPMIEPKKKGSSPPRVESRGFGSDKVIHVLRSLSVSEESPQDSAMSNVLLASVIQTPPASVMKEKTPSHSSIDTIPTSGESDSGSSSGCYRVMNRSSTFSALQTDL